MLSIDSNAQPYLKSLGSCLTRVVAEGFTEEFRTYPGGLEAISSKQTYPKEAIEITNCFRFKGKSPDQSEVILLIVQTNDGTRGTLVLVEPFDHDLFGSLQAKC